MASGSEDAAMASSNASGGVNATDWATPHVILGVDINSLPGSDAERALVYFLLNVVVCSVIPIPLAGPLIAAGALLFGIAAGMALNVSSSVVGAYVALLLTRSFCRPCMLGALGSKGKARWQALDAALTADGPVLALLIRLSPLSPMVLTNVLLSLTSLSQPHYLWTTAVGIVPGNLPYAYAAKVTAELADASHEDPLMISLTAVGLLASLALALRVATLARRALAKHRLDGNHARGSGMPAVAEDWCPPSDDAEAIELSPLDEPPPDKPAAPDGLRASVQSDASLASPERTESKALLFSTSARKGKPSGGEGGSLARAGSRAFRALEEDGEAGGEAEVDFGELPTKESSQRV